MGDPTSDQAAGSMEWELSKENFQPLKRGRGPEKLQETAPSPSLSKTMLDETRRLFCKEIDEYDGDDPLEPWLRYIKWTQSTFKAGGHKAELLPLLERCTRQLQQQERYKKDSRYLRLWIQYADCLPEPQDVFAFLVENDIGQDFALFYIAYAAYLELRGSFEKAEAVFQTGLERMAVPVRKLEVKHDDFQARMARRRLREAEEGTAHSSEEDPRPARTTLGVIGRKGRTASGLSSFQGASGVAKSRRREAAAAPDKENSGADLEVYVDDSFQPGAAPGRPGGAELRSGTTGGAWSQLSGFEATRKENEQRAAKFKGSRFKQNKALMQPADPHLDIPQDEDLIDVAPITTKPPQGTLRQRLESATSEEALQHDPLRLFKDPALAASQRQESAGRQKPSGPGKPGKAALEVVLPVGPDGEAISFEEIRAERWLASQRAAAVASPGPPPSSPCHSDDMAISTTPDARCRPSPRPMELSAPSPQQHTAASSPAFITSDAGRTGPVNLSPRPSAGCQPHSGSESLAGDSGPPDVTINTLLAFDSVNNMFKGALPHDLSWDNNEATATVRLPLPEPTVTISTRAAFSAVNSMFKASLPHEGLGRSPAGFGKQGRVGSPGDRNGGGAEVYQDTDFLPRRPREQTESFAPYEDTDFLPRRKSPDKTEGLDGVYQDTEFLPRRKSPGKIGGLDGVYQDTEFLDGRGARSRTAKDPHSSAGRMDTQGFGEMYQDTEFLGDGRGRAKVLAGDQTEGFQVYEDTNFLSLPEGSRPGSGGNVSTPYPAAVEDRENCAPGS